MPVDTFHCPCRPHSPTRSNSSSSSSQSNSSNVQRPMSMSSNVQRPIVLGQKKGCLTFVRQPWWKSLAATYSPTLLSAVPSAMKGLTSEFGMGSGISPSPMPPRKIVNFTNFAPVPCPCSRINQISYTRKNLLTHIKQRLKQFFSIYNYNFNLYSVTTHLSHVFGMSSIP